jgi:hypothetical protein
MKRIDCIDPSQFASGRNAGGRERPRVWLRIQQCSAEKEKVPTLTHSDFLLVAEAVIERVE